MEKILFIIPPHLKFEDFVNPPFNVRERRKGTRRFGCVITDMPLGPMALSAYLKKHVPVEIRLLDFNVLLNKVSSFEYPGFADYFRDVLSQREWQEFDPTIVGMTVLFSPSYQNFLDIAQCCWELFPQAAVMGGGHVPTTMHKEIFRDSTAVDALCHGEGEIPLLEYLQASDRGQYLGQSPHWVTPQKKDQGACAFRQSFVLDLDEIPRYDYSLLQVDDYALNPALTAYAGVLKRQREYNAHYMTSRGCIFRCTFCGSFRVNGRTMRYHSVPRVREDLQYLRDELGARTIVMQDDHFMGDQDRALEIINIIGELGLKVVFQNSLTLFALKRPMIEAMKRAGVDQLLLSVESGSARVLKLMHKPLTLPIVAQVASDCRDLGIYTECNILIGIIGETPKDIDDSRTFLQTIGANWFKIFIATPLVGSEMYDIAMEHGYLQGDPVDFDFKKPNVVTPDLSADFLRRMQYIMNLELNFVHNSDIRRGDYRTALLGILNAVESKPNHAFGHHYAAFCYEQLGEREKAQHHRSMAQAAAADPFWQEYIRVFGAAIPNVEELLPAA